MFRPGHTGQKQALSDVGGNAYRYRVFLSYAHADRRWARQVSRLLETWKVPGRLVGTQGDFGPVPGTLGPVFRDRDELSASAELGATINKALRESAAMVVICSPAAARSKWVNEEIRAFKALGRADRIFSFIVDGDPTAGDDLDQCFPPALRFQVDAEGYLTDAPAEPIAADARHEGDGPRRARLRLLAGLLGVGYDELQQREQHRRNQRLVAITAAAVLGMAITLGLAISAYIARDDAQRRQAQAEALIDFLIGPLHKELRTIGRTDVLVSLGEEAMKYFSSLAPRDLNDDVLARQAQALTQIGEVAIDQGRLEDAQKALVPAYERLLELSQRSPGDGRRVFDLAQAAFYVGKVYWDSRDLEQAEAWFKEYRNATRRLAEIDRERLDWLRERAYGDQNLASVLFEKGEVQAAMDIYAEEVETLRELKSRGFELELIDLDIADVVSWLGSGAERLGDLEAAESHFRESATILESLVEERPEDRRVPPQLGNVLIHLSRILAVTGQTDEALRCARQAAGAYALLHDLDPENAGWARSYYIARRTVAELAASTGNAEEAESVLGELAEDDGTAEGRGEPIPRHAIVSALARAAIALDAGDAAAAADLADRALEGAEHALAEDPGDPNVVGSLAMALILRGSAGRAAGDPDSGARDFQRAFEVLAPFAEGSRFWVILDPFARSALLLGRAELAETTLQLLKSMGYQPLWPWPQAS